MIGVADEIKGQVPRGFVVLKAGASAEGLTEELVSGYAKTSAPWRLSRPSTSCAALPKTRSGKILRKTMRGIADGKDEPVPSTIEDPAVLDALKPILTGLSFAETELVIENSAKRNAQAQFRRGIVLRWRLNTSSN